MGIPGFLRWLQHEFPSACRTASSIDAQQFHTLFIDLNSTLHQVADASSGDVDYISATVDSLIQLIKPKTLVYLAIDGVPPRMKERLQRERRAVLAGSHNPKDQARAHGPSFNRYSITPGTKWMYKLEAHLEEFITQKRDVDSQWKEIKVIFSGCRDPGEGEQKIIDYLRAQGSSNTSYKHCLWSNDADTVLLSLAAHVPNITIVSERIHNGISAYKVVDIDALESSILKRYAPKTSDVDPASARSSRQVIDDLVFMTFFAGNDFLPPASYLQAPSGAAFIDHLWTMYSRLPAKNLPLHDRGRIDIRALRELMSWFDSVGQQQLVKKHIGVTALGSQLTALRVRRMSWATQRAQIGDSKFTPALLADTLEEDMAEGKDQGRKNKRKKGSKSKLSRSERRLRRSIAKDASQGGNSVPYVWTGSIADLEWTDENRDKEVGMLEGSKPAAEPFAVYRPLASECGAPTLTLHQQPLISPILASSFKLMVDLAGGIAVPGAIEVIGHVDTARIRWLQSFAGFLGLACTVLKPKDAEFANAYQRWKGQRTDKAALNACCGPSTEGGRSGQRKHQATIVIGDLDYCPPTHIINIASKGSLSSAVTLATVSLVNEDAWDVLYADARTEYRRDQEVADWKSGFYHRHYNSYGSSFVDCLCSNYANALGWTALYYFRGVVSSWDFTWPEEIESSQQGVAPLASDLLSFLELSGDSWMHLPASQGQPPLPREHMISVLPKDSWSLLDPVERELAGLLFDSQQSDDARQQVRDRMATRPEDVASVRIWL